MGIIAALIGVLVPALVAAAEKKFDQPKQGDQKHTWVTEAVHDALDAVGKHMDIPNWAAEVEPGIEKLLDDAILAAVQKIDP